mmetsp:Transcript_16101/g.18660  ORF Transcript_16101/g.18660 Transcript_16101/m.18660 type:complete len:497 (-) Transcript_16101:236-1726(-)
MHMLLNRSITRAAFQSLGRRNIKGLSSTNKVSNGCLNPRFMSSLPYHLVVGMPALSPTMEVGTISSWKIREGESFAAGDSLAEIETDKATIDFEAQDEGVVAKILVEASSNEINVGVPILVTVEDFEDVAAFKDFIAEEKSDNDRSDNVEGGTTTPELESTAEKKEVPKEHKLMPSARHLSQSRNLDATVLRGTGKDGRVTKGDFLKALKDGVELPPIKPAVNSERIFIATAAASPNSATVSASITAAHQSEEAAIPSITTSGSYTDIANNNMRKVIARRLTESKSTVPHFYTTVEIELDNILALRKKLAGKDVKVSVNDLIIRGSALALRDVPEVNASFNKNGVKMNNSVDISVAVATPGGLITPIVPKTDTIGLIDISNKIKDLASRAREGKLSPDEYQGGTFCISNLGMFGITEFSAVINPPQGAILAVGGGVKNVVMNTPYVEGSEQQEKPGIKTVMTARLSADRRVVDEATVSLFLSTLKCYLNKPELLML